MVLSFVLRDRLHYMGIWLEVTAPGWFCILKQKRKKQKQKQKQYKTKNKIEIRTHYLNSQISEWGEIMLFDPNSENCDKYCLSALTHLKKKNFTYMSILQWNVLISSPETGQKQLANDKHVLETFAHFLTRKSVSSVYVAATCTD